MALFKLAIIRSARVRTSVAALAGFLAYGSWAYYINGGSSEPLALRSGLVQGGYSFLITLLFSGSMELLIRRIRIYPRFFSVLIPSIILFFLSYLIHFINETPKPISTLLPSYCMSILTAIGYVLFLDSLSKERNS